MVQVIWERDGWVRLDTESQDPAVRQLLLRHGVTAEQAVADVESCLKAEDPAAAAADVLYPGWRERKPEPESRPGPDLAVEAARLTAEVATGDLDARVAALEEAVARLTTR